MSNPRAKIGDTIKFYAKKPGWYGYEVYLGKVIEVQKACHSSGLAYTVMAEDETFFISFL